MTELNQIYKCEVCGNVVEMKHSGAGELVCCNQPMKLMTENTEDAATEKHVPIVEKKEDKIIVTVGEVKHPMEDGHYIEWVQAIVDGKSIIKYLKPSDDPKVEFCCIGENVIVRAYCNLHGLWKA